MTILILTVIPILGYSQDDNFEIAIIQLEELSYYVTDKGLTKNKHYRTAEKFELNWINESINYCNSLSWIDRELQPINLDKIIIVKHVTIKSNIEIERNLYPSAKLIQVEFTDSLEAIRNEKILREFDFSEKECIHKAPWTFWRIDNKLNFIITRSMIFGQEIPKIQKIMNQHLK